MTLYNYLFSKYVSTFFDSHSSFSPLEAILHIISPLRQFRKLKGIKRISTMEKVDFHISVQAGKEYALLLHKIKFSKNTFHVKLW